MDNNIQSQSTTSGRLYGITQSHLPIRLNYEDVAPKPSSPEFGAPTETGPVHVCIDTNITKARVINRSSNIEDHSRIKCYQPKPGSKPTSSKKLRALIVPPGQKPQVQVIIDPPRHKKGLKFLKQSGPSEFLSVLLNERAIKVFQQHELTTHLPCCNKVPQIMGKCRPADVILKADSKL